MERGDATIGGSKGFDRRVQLGVAGVALLISAASMWIAEHWFQCAPLSSGRLACERLDGIPLLLLFSLAVGLMAFLYRAISPSMVPRLHDRATVDHVSEPGGGPAA